MQILDLYDLQSLLSEVGVDISLSDLSKLSREQRKQARKWADAVYLRERGNKVKVPCRPAFLTKLVAY